MPRSRRRRSSEETTLHDRLTHALLSTLAGSSFGLVLSFINGWDFLQGAALGGAAGAVLGFLLGPQAWQLLLRIF
jgi:uncharacterized membrane protein YgaE (UPF0421/DUF939 family)